MSTLSRLLPLCTLGLCLGLGFAWFRSDSRPDAPAVAPASSVPAPAPPVPSVPADSPGDLPRTERDPAAAPDESAPLSAPTLSEEARDRLFAAIEEAYTTYDVSALPRLTPHLRHPDPEVRTFAREAIVQLGHIDGVAALRAAARDARDPREATELLDAADFLEIPPAQPISADAFLPVAGRTSAARRTTPPVAPPSF
jgi:hypothetical protein